MGSGVLISKEMEWPYANKSYSYHFSKDITTGNHNTNISIYIMAASRLNSQVHLFSLGLSRIIFAGHTKNS